MGHLFRALNLAKQLQKQGLPFLVCLNDHQPSIGLIRRAGLVPTVVSLTDLDSNWEAELIRRNGITVWVNDRLDTDIRHAQHVINAAAKFVTFDDRGTGAALADIHFAPLAIGASEQLKGKRVLQGTTWLVLNEDIGRFRRERRGCARMIVTLGGADTYGATPKVLAILKKQGRPATVIVGPGFEHHRELEELATAEVVVKRGVPSLVEEFHAFDLAVTGGGVTAYEAAASGLPTIIVANEHFEIPNALYLQSIGASVFAGHHTEIDDSVFYRDLDIPGMSRAGMYAVATQGAENIVRELIAL